MDSSQPRMHIEADGFATRFDRIPFGFKHNLHTLDLFSGASLRELAGRYAPHPSEYFVAAAAASAGTAFNSVRHGQCGPQEAVDRLNDEPVRVLLKRPENRDPRFRQLLDQLFAQVMELRGGLQGEKVARLESAVFITSKSAITPCHFDPEIAFFAQIRGQKIYHVYAPESVSEIERERFYQKGIVSISEVDPASRDPSLERVYNLMPGDGHHQPQDCPHWVQTGNELSVSYSFVFETDVGRARGRTRAANYFLRGIGVSPTPPGVSPARDAVKAAAIRVAFPIRRRVQRLVSRG
jgi:hypothetical protein